MKVLTIREPWASLIGKGIKIIETRSWSTNYRGELYIHAGLYKVPKNDQRVCRLSSYLNGEPYMYGKIFLKCTLDDCVYIDEEFVAKVKKDNALNFECGDYTVGRYAWIINDVERIDPISARGHLGIWNYKIK